jgi:hypothetical protein
MRMHWKGCVDDASPGGCDEDESQECNENVLQEGAKKMQFRRV